SVRADGKDGWNDPSSDHYIEDCLYDLQADPHELKNLAGFTSHAHVAEVLRKRLIDRMAAAGESPPRITPAPEVSGEQRSVTNDDARA
ncbi:MAG: arylsulfatase, partial [Gemmatimonadaceae bacterium]